MRKEKVSAQGSVVAATAASVCCIGPLVAVLLGTGSLAAASGLQRWRPVFLGVTFVMLAVAWYLTYRKPKAEVCEDGVSCAGKPAAKGSKAILWIATILAIGLAALPLYAGAVARLVHPDGPAPVRSAGANVASLRVRIPSMDCAACAVNIERTLAKKEGIESARVTFKTKEAVVEYDAARISPDGIVAAIDETGFKAELVTKKGKQ